MEYNSNFGNNYIESTMRTSITNISGKNLARVFVLVESETIDQIVSLNTV